MGPYARLSRCPFIVVAIHRRARAPAGSCRREQQSSSSGASMGPRRAASQTPDSAEGRVSQHTGLSQA
eukprot:CAMPEP_0185200912 /NCGR_PEP_ID=MMETSP1140-20130426/48258_1 /TAXON_ID=298111 /ORGANISM="Pavlova sp., Strain CCMP459" /LENGTH=67 /DNA_ID=CAMNT_0027768283 /DNA_START=85 /DNA_END=284 /DNA_ORIENTATION=+